MINLISIFMLSAAIFFLSRPHKSILISLTCLPLIAFGFLSLTTYYIIDSQTGAGINEAAIYHIKSGLGGAGFSEFKMQILGAFGLIVALPATLWLISRRIWKSIPFDSTRQLHALTIFFSIAASILGPLQFEIINYATSTPLVYDNHAANEKYISKHTSQTISSIFNTPSLAATGEHTKNLVYIYAESLERTYFDASLFPGLLPQLSKLKARSIDFSGIAQLPGTEWTIAGMVASQCGIPLYTTANGNSMWGVDKFLPGTRCIGDLLQEHGYSLHYYGGAKTSFAGKGLFLESHGFNEINGREQLFNTYTERGVRPRESGWGLHDDLVLDEAFGEFLNLSNAGEKFALFLLTLDTHHPTGHPSASCRYNRYQAGQNKILNAVKCSDQLIAKFISQILNSPYAKNTIIVVSSDHLAMKNTAWDMLTSNPEKRKNLFFMLAPPLPSSGLTIDQAGNMFDILPTVFSQMDFDLKLGLGRNLFTEQSVFTSADEFKPYSKNIRQLVYGFWDFPSLKENLMIAPDGMLSIDDRTLTPPVLIEFDDNFSSTVTFANYAPDLSYRDNLPQKIKGEKTFVLIDECRHFSRIELPKKSPPIAFTDDQMCIFAGKDSLNFWSQLPKSKPLIMQRKYLEAYSSPEKH